MSELNRLIQELCPEGVPYRALGEVFDIRNGYTPSKANSSFWENGTIPWFRMEDIRANGRKLSTAIQYVTSSALKGGGLFPAGSFILGTSATIGEYARIEVDFLANQRFTILCIKDSFKKELASDFLFHYMHIIAEWCKQNVNSSSFSSVKMDSLKKLRIPVPPLPVQAKIAEILDKFTQLEAELEAELEARRKQYEYYRNELLSFDNLVKRGGVVRLMALGEICETLTPKIKIQKQDYLSSGNYPVIDQGQTFIAGYTDAEGVYPEDEYVIFGDHTCAIKYVNFAFAQGADGIKVLKAKEEIIKARFLYYRMKCVNIESGYSRHWTKMKSTEIPVPPLTVQAEIVAILDKFDALTNDLSKGLPAELAMRRAQYEYYRDKLLTFSEKESA